MDPPKEVRDREAGICGRRRRWEREGGKGRREEGGWERKGRGRRRGEGEKRRKMEEKGKGREGRRERGKGKEEERARKEVLLVQFLHMYTT